MVDEETRRWLVVSLWPKTQVRRVDARLFSLYQACLRLLGCATPLWVFFGERGHTLFVVVSNSILSG